MCYIFHFADYLQIDVIFESLCSLFISSTPEIIPNYLYLLLVHYGESHPTTLSCMERVNTYLYQNSLPPNFNIVSVMRSKLTENDIRHVDNQLPMSLLIREQHRWSTFRLKRKIIRKQARAMKHMERTKTMTCFACVQPGRYLEVDNDSFIYRMAHRAPCCGYFMHRYCAININR